MAKRNEFELRVVESMGPLPAIQVTRRIPPMRRRSAPTRTEALKTLRAMQGAASVIERVPMLEQIDAWSEIAYWDVCKTSGAAAPGGVFLWDCDFPGIFWNMFDGWANCFAYFSGPEQLGDVTPPDTLTGQVWCYLDAPSDGYYLFVAQVQTYVSYSGNYSAVIECFIDSSSFGTRTLYEGSDPPQVFVARLSAGHHRFRFRQATGAFFFESLSAWQIPVLRAE